MRGKKFNVADYIGKTFGERTVIAGVSSDKRKCSLVTVRCSCGRVSTVKLSDLLRGKHRLCFFCTTKLTAKLRGDTLRNRIQRDGSKITDRMMRQWQRGAKRRGHAWSTTTTKEYLQTTFDSQNHKCKLSGRQLVVPYVSRSDHANVYYGNASLDRIDSTKGYIPGNVQLVDKQVNNAKNDSTDQEFITMCAEVTAHQQALTKLKEANEAANVIPQPTQACEHQATCYPYTYVWMVQN